MHRVPYSFTYRSYRTRSSGSSQRLPKVTYDLILEDLNLQPEEVGGLWASVQEVVHPDYWNPSQWKPGSQMGRSVHDAMRDCSINLICKFLTQLTVGPVAQRNISGTHRLKFLYDLSDRKATPTYPVVSPNIPTAADYKCWEIRSLHYSLGYCSAASVALISQLRGLNSPKRESFLKAPHTSFKLQHHSDQITDATVDLTKSSQDDPQLADNIVNRNKEIHDKEIEGQDPIKGTPNVTTDLSQLENNQNHKSRDYDSDNLHDIDNCNIRNPLGNEDKGLYNDMVEGSFAETEYDEESEENGTSVYRDPQTGQYFTSEYNPNEDPGVSIQLEIPGEEILVTPEMLQRAEELCAEEEEADTLAVSAVLTYERAWAEITQRAISIGRLSPLAFATLARQYLAASNRHIDDHLLYWEHQQVLISKADRDLKEAILKVKRDNQLLAEIKGTTVEMAEKLAANQQKELMASNLVEVPEPKPDLQRPTVPQGLRTKLDFKRRQHLLRFGSQTGNNNGRGLSATLSRNRLSPTAGTSCTRIEPVPFAKSPTHTDGTPTTTSNSTTSSPKSGQKPATGAADMGSKLRESMGL